MELTLIGTCFSHKWDGSEAHKAIIGLGNGEWRLSIRKLESAEEALRYGKRLFYRLARTGRWEIVPLKTELGQSDTVIL